MSGYDKLARQFESERKAAARAVRWGVFHWTPAGVYPPDEAIRVFATERRAEDYATRENERIGQGRTGLVVRSIKE